MVNYLSLFCQNLQKLLAPIYDLTRKGRPFIWTESHQKTFDTIKQQLAKAPVLSLPDGIGRYILYSDTSKTHAGSAFMMLSFQDRIIKLRNYFKKEEYPFLGMSKEKKRDFRRLTKQFSLDKEDNFTILKKTRITQSE